MKLILDRLAHALIAFGPWGVFLLSLADSLGIPLPMAADALVIAEAVASTAAPARAWITALLAVLGSVAGNVALYQAARHGRRLFDRGQAPSARTARFQAWFHRYGLLTVFIPALSPIPMPLKVFVISAGALHAPLSRFLAVVALARAMRYFGLAYLGLQLGKDAPGFLQRNGWILAGFIILVALAAALLIRWHSRRRQSILI